MLYDELGLEPLDKMVDRRGGVLQIIGSLSLICSFRARSAEREDGVWGKSLAKQWNWQAEALEQLRQKLKCPPPLDPPAAVPVIKKIAKKKRIVKRA
jgi:hypothetical protein